MKIIFIICGILFPTWLFSENNTSFSNVSFGMKIGFENSYFSYKDLNDFLVNNGYYPLNDNDNLPSLCLGIEFTTKQSPLHVSCTIQKSIMKTDRSLQSNINYTGFGVDAFYDFCKNEKWILAPMMGVSLLDVNLFSVSQNKISELTQTNLQEGLSKMNLFCINPGFTVSRTFTIQQFLGSVGIDSYYQIEMGDGKWKDVLNKKVDSVVASKMTGFVFGINLTFYFP